MSAYLDNAATTPLDPQVLEAMMPYLTNHFGNPSSIHKHGREVRAGIEKARKQIAELLNTSPSEIFFTSGGTEADNCAIYSSLKTFGIKRAITSKVEHHAVLHTLQHLEKTGEITLHYVDLNEQGAVLPESLEKLLAGEEKTFVSLMQGNNEIGNLISLEEIGNICKMYGAIFHSDTVQTMGHYPHILSKLPVDFVVGAAHKFHGPKGVGFLYINHQNKINPFIHGGSQERNMRGGTENVYGIVGMAKALELAYEDMKGHQEYILGLKKYMMERLKAHIQGVQFNGLSADLDRSLYTVLNVSFPYHEDNDMLLFNLDIAKISVSGGSACSSGSSVGSHVLSAINAEAERGNVRFSFSRFTTKEEVDYTINKVSELYRVSDATLSI